MRRSPGKENPGLSGCTASRSGNASCADLHGWEVQVACRCRKNINRTSYKWILIPSSKEGSVSRSRKMERYLRHGSAGEVKHFPKATKAFDLPRRAEC